MDNSAYRLLQLLEKAKGHPDSTPCVRVWRSVFEVPNDIEVLGRLGHLMVLIEESTAEIAELDPSSANAVDHWRNQLLSGFSTTNLHSPWKDFSRFIDTHTLQYLNLQSKLINSLKPKTDLNRAQLSQARDELSAALGSIRESQLPPATKMILVDRIRDLIEAIDDYTITGQSAIFDAYKLAAVDLRDVLIANPNIPGKSHLRAGLSIVADLMTIATAAVALTGPSLQLLELVK